MEEKNVMISIRGLQKVDGVDQEPVELITPGVLSQVGGGYHLTYRETALTGLEGTITSFQVYPEQVSMVRMGTVCLQMVFEKRAAASVRLRDPLWQYVRPGAHRT